MLRICLVCKVWTILDWQGGITNVSFIIRQQVSSVKTTSEETHTNMHCALHAYLHARIHGPCSPHSHMHKQSQCELAQTPNTLCRAAAGVNAGVTRHVSHSIPPARTGDSPRGQKWAKDGNLIPSRKSNAPASAASVIHSSCDTAAMCWGLFLRNGRVELESSRISLASVWTMSWRGQGTFWRSGRFLSALKERFW